MKKLILSLLTIVTVFTFFSVQPARADERVFFGFGSGGHGREFHERHGYYRAHDEGRWYRGRHGARNGWWFVSGSTWYPVRDRYQYPVIIEQEPVVIYRQAPQPVVMPTPVNIQAPITNGYCREFQSTIKIGNRAQPAYGTACQQPDGTWKVISQQLEE
jgi:hypothetical protein